MQHSIKFLVLIYQQPPITPLHSLLICNTQHCDHITPYISTTISTLQLSLQILDKIQCIVGGSLTELTDYLFVATVYK